MIWISLLLKFGLLRKQWRKRHNLKSAQINLVTKKCHMKSFLSYLVDGIPRDEFTETIDDAVEQAKLCDEWRKEFMTLEMRDWEKREEGIGIGIEKGREEGIVIGREKGREEGIVIGCEKGKNEAKAEMIMNMLSKGFSEETLLDLDFSASEIQAAKKEMA